MSRSLRSWIIAISLFIVVGGAITLVALYQAFGTYRLRYRLSGPPVMAEINYHPGDTLFSRTRLRQETITLPWEYEIRSDNFMHRRYALLSVRAEAEVSVTCEVWINDHLVANNTGDGATSCGYDPEQIPLP